MSMKGNGSGIQSGGLSWAKKMVVLRTEVSGIWLFYNFFIRLVYNWLLGYYIGDWTL